MSKSRFMEIYEASKNDNSKKIVSVGQKTRGVMIVQTKDGEKYEVTAKDTNGDMPKVGKLITDYISIDK